MKKLPFIEDLSTGEYLCPICSEKLVEGKTDFFLDIHSVVCIECANKARTDEEFYWDIKRLAQDEKIQECEGQVSLFNNEE